MVHIALIALAVVTVVGLSVVFVQFFVGARTIRNLVDQPGRSDGPLVSVIVAARDEGPNIERALGSLLAQAYDRLEIVAIDDRSTDDTGVVLERMAARDPRIRVVHITKLPPHWLGKNHALHTGAALAGGEYLLFTDADIVFDQQAIGRAVAFMESRALDHLTLGPELDSPSTMLELVVTFFTLGFFLYYRPWHAPDPTRQEHLGIGAFNMVKASLYRGFGGHSRIPLRPDDDIKLGRMVKLSGGRQMVAGGFGVIKVRWYSTVGELARGLRKNTFAGLNYSVPLAIGGVLVQIVGNIWPFVALFVTSGPLWWLNAAAATLMMVMFVAVAIGSGANPWLALGYPIAAMVLVYIFVAAVWITLRRGGIEWRGTFYSLAELKSNRV